MDYTDATVMHVFGSLDKGGGEVRTLELVRSVRGRGIRTLMCVTKRHIGTLQNDFLEAGARIVPIPIKGANVPLDFLFALRFLRILRRERVDVVQSHIYYTSGIIVLLSWIAGVRTRVSVFRTDGKTPKSWQHRATRYIMRSLVHGFSSHIVGVSPSALEHAVGRRGFRRAKTMVIANGLDLRNYGKDSRLDRRGGAIVRSVQSTGYAVVMLHVGRGIATKNRPLAVRVLSACQDQGLTAALLFVGRDAEQTVECLRNRNELEALARELGVYEHLHFLGERADVPDLMSAADLLLSTSTLEGLPGVILEALACGKPVVSGDLPGVRFIAEQVGGVEIVPLDAPCEAWVEAVRRALLSHESDEESASRLAGSCFDLRVAAESYLELWGQQESLTDGVRADRKRGN